MVELPTRHWAVGIIVILVDAKLHHSKLLIFGKVTAAMIAAFKPMPTASEQGTVAV